MSDREGAPFSWLEGSEEEIWEHALELIASGSYTKIGACGNAVHDTGYLSSVQVARSALGRCRFCDVPLKGYACPECKRKIDDGGHSPFYLP